MFRIFEKQQLGPRMHLMRVAAPLIARKAEPGQFVIVRTCETGERLPLTIADFERDAGVITMVFQEMGKGTQLLARLGAGDDIPDVLGPQGVPTETHPAGGGIFVVVGGGIGIAPVYPLARKLSAEGNRVIAVIGYRSREYVFWEERMRAVSRELLIATNDGSYGRKGMVTDILAEVIARPERPDCVYAIGPAVMMKAVADLTRPSGIPTIVSLNSLMVCGMGMCGACRVTVGGKTRFTCMDGPDFDGHQVDFAELMQRLATYQAEEQLSASAVSCARKGGDHHGR